MAAINRVSYNLFSLLTIKYFTPSHVIIILIFGEMEYCFETIMRGKIYFTIIIFLILFFLILVFTEVIELNFLGISDNVQRNIKKRAQNTENIINSRNNSESDDKVEIKGLYINLGVNDDDENYDNRKSFSSN